MHKQVIESFSLETNFQKIGLGRLLGNLQVGFSCISFYELYLDMWPGTQRVRLLSSFHLKKDVDFDSLVVFVRD